jgi:hypothetical protein
MHLTVVMRLGLLHSHLIPTVTMKGIAVNDHCLDAFTVKDPTGGSTSTPEKRGNSSISAFHRPCGPRHDEV